MVDELEVDEVGLDELVVDEVKNRPSGCRRGARLPQLLHCSDISISLNVYFGMITFTLKVVIFVVH